MSGRSEKYVTQEHFQKVMTHFVGRLLQIQFEMASFEKALTEAGLVTEDQLRQARERAKAEGKAVLDSLTASTPDKLLEILRGFEGPAQ